MPTLCSPKTQDQKRYAPGGPKTGCLLKPAKQNQDESAGLQDGYQSERLSFPTPWLPFHTPNPRVQLLDTGQLSKASCLWTESKKEISPQQHLWSMHRKHSFGKEYLKQDSIPLWELGWRRTASQRLFLLSFQAESFPAAPCSLKFNHFPACVVLFSPPPCICLACSVPDILFSVGASPECHSSLLPELPPGRKSLGSISCHGPVSLGPLWGVC
jgi:hypothetical protein